jgi:hypothetical protein
MQGNSMKPMDQGSKDKKLKDIKELQFQYMGRWVSKEHFRAFVYNEKGDQKLAESYNDYQNLIASGIWYDTQKLAEEAEKRGKRNDPLRSNSK